MTSDTRQRREWYGVKLDVQVEPQFAEQFGREITQALLDFDFSMFIVLDGLVIVPRCDGSSSCRASDHIEGCYAGAALGCTAAAKQDTPDDAERCHYCGLLNPGPEHNAYAPQLCAEKRS